MSSLCSYCNQAELTKARGRNLWFDVSARALSVARTCLEHRANPEASLRDLAKAIVDPSSLPLATEHDRRCPYCRRGHVTRLSPSTVWIDLMARCGGVSRRANDLLLQRSASPWYTIAWLAVDGEGQPETLRARQETTEEPPSAHEQTASIGSPIDLEPDEFGDF